MTNILLSILIHFAMQSCHQADDSVQDRFGLGENVAILSTYDLVEASGMVASMAHKDRYWVINDSGNPAKVYLIDKKANIIRDYWINGAINLDWEDIAIYTDKSSGAGKVAIADIGDNFAIRDHIRLYIFDEAETVHSSDTTISKVEMLMLKYEDGPRDAEALIIDPLTSEIFIITKREPNVRLYSAPLDFSADTIQLKLETTLPFFLITAADITIDGTEILMKDYNAIYYWQRTPGETIPQTLLKPHELLPYIPEPQGESIAWELNGNGFYTLSERNEPKEQILYYYKRN